VKFIIMQFSPRSIFLPFRSKYQHCSQKSSVYVPSSKRDIEPLNRQISTMLLQDATLWNQRPFEHVYLFIRKIRPESRLKKKENWLKFALWQFSQLGFMLERCNIQTIL
jgi:hypothetical protein